jgi:hypothetical protein
MSWISLVQYSECITAQMIEKLGLIPKRSRDFSVFPIIHSNAATFTKETKSLKQELK